MKTKHEQIRDAILGLAIGDAVGVPYEFTQPHHMKERPATDMVGGGSHGQPAGTWSDDTSLTLTLMKGLAESRGSPDYNKIMEYSLVWLDKGDFTATGKVFDVGKTCLKSIMNFARGEDPVYCGQTGEYDCGNGSLMRCLPLVFWLREFYGNDFIKNDQARKIIHEVSSLTHGYPRCLLANGLYLSIAEKLLEGVEKNRAVKVGLLEAKAEYMKDSIFADQLQYFDRLFSEGFEDTTEGAISARGYVVDTLETALWSFLRTDSYRSCILKAINQGHDTDTTAAIAGGLAGIYYGYESIPQKWRDGLLKSNYIEDLCVKYSKRLETG